LRRGELRLISEATHETLDACRRLLPGFAESFRIVPVSRLSTDATQDIASRILQEAKRNYRIDADEPCAATAVGLYKRYLPYLSPPKGPVTLLQRMVSESRKTNATSISNAQVLDRFSRETGLPPHIICDSIRIKPQELKQHFDSEVIGQPEATTVAVDTIVKLKAGLVDPQRPVATMLFCGPTGVGKTQLAQSIADYVLASKGGSGWSPKAKNDRLVRLDMSEYQSWGAVDRLLMTPQGEPALWIQRLRTWPLGVLLFDEFEKAAPEVFDCLLSAFDEGRITDRFGRTTTLCGTIIVLTSNVGANQSASTGFVNDQSRRYARALEQTFRPEFLNRLDAITTFQPLSRETTRLIVEKELRAINDRPAMRERQLQLRWPSELVDELAEVGFDPALGARPLQRAIERVVVAPLAKWLLSRQTHQRIIEWDEVSALTR
jgi:ATP-dependent Clp protease ATP-binding subunit ClpC